MNIAAVIILFIVALFVVVFLHELGHFITAKRAGVKVEEFGLGFPPRLFGIKRGETVYSINAIPVGAFVKSVGEDDPTVPRSLASKRPWPRLAVYVAGPLANIFLAFVLLSAFFMIPSSVIVGDGVMVHSVVEDSPAEQASIEAGDIILEANGERVHKWGDVQNIISSSEEGEEITLVLQKDGSQEEVGLIPQFNPDLGRLTVGVTLCWNIVSQVEDGSPADEAGIRPKDTILSVNKQAVYSKEDMSRALASVEEGGEIYLTLLREGESISASLIKKPDSDQRVMGMKLRWVDGTHIGQERLPLWKAAHLGGSYIIYLPEMIVASIPLIKENPGLALVGPVGAGQLTVEWVKSFGLSNILFMAGIVSLGIALFNFLPIPPLDGAGMLVAFIEGLRRGKRLSRRTLRLAYTIGTTLLTTLMVLVTYNDILRIITGGSFGL
jgi:regulator of sigma E protease